MVTSAQWRTSSESLVNRMLQTTLTTNKFYPNSSESFLTFLISSWDMPMQGSSGTFSTLNWQSTAAAEVVWYWDSLLLDVLSAGPCFKCGGVAPGLECGASSTGEDLSPSWDGGVAPNSICWGGVGPSPSWWKGGVLPLMGWEEEQLVFHPKPAQAEIQFSFIDPKCYEWMLWI